MKATMLSMLLISMLTFIAHAQPGLPPPADMNPSAYLISYARRASGIANQLQEKSQAMIAAVERAERKAIVKIAKRDSSQAALVAASLGRHYTAYRRLLSDTAQIDPLQQLYVGILDSAAVVTKLLNMAGLSDRQRALLGTVQQELGGLQQVFTRTHLLQEALNDRVRVLRSVTGGLGAMRTVTKITNRVARYKASWQDLRSLANEPDKALSTLLTALSQTSLFRQFFDRYSILGAITPGAPTVAVDPALTGTMQVRNTVMTAVAQTAGISQVSQRLQQAGSELVDPVRVLKDKVRSLKRSKQIDDHATAEQVGKPLRKRLEWGANLQSVRAGQYFPVTTDLGLSIGFRINKRSLIGVGASYKWGWGKGIRAISLSHEGMSLRSFVNASISGSFHATGGWELHYQQPFESFRSLPAMQSWRQSALLGIMKQVRLRNRLLKSTQFQLLFDMLAIHSSNPPVIFRVGYQFNHQ